MIKGSNGTSKIKVSQATIDKIKKMGMTAALKSAPNANPEMTEALRRMYGQRRLDAATKSTAKLTAGMGRSSKGMIPSAAPSAISGKKVTTTPAKKAAPAKSSSMGLLGVTRGATSKPKSTTTSASVTDRRKAAAAAVKRAGGRSM